MWILLVVLGLAVFAALGWVVTLRRISSTDALIVSGKMYGKHKGKAVAIHLGGTTNVVPLVQQATTLSLIPMTIPANINDAPSKGKIKVDISSNFQIAFSDRIELLENAAKRLVGLERSQIAKIVKDIIDGGLRATITQLTVDELNDDRDRFVGEVEKQVKPELDKLGIIITNVNIESIQDEAGYIDALGQKEAERAVNQAKIEVSEQKKDGAIGVSKNEAEQRVAVEEAETNSVKGIATTQKEREVEVSKLDAEKARQKIEFQKERLAAEAELAEQQAETKRRKEIADSKATQAIIAEQKIEDKLLMEKEHIVVEQIEKEKAIIEADAEAEVIKKKADAEAYAVKAKFEAEAEGIEKVLKAKAEGYKEMFKDVDSGVLLGMEYLKKAEALQQINADAMSKLKVDSINVIDSGNGKATANLIDGFIGSLPGAHQTAKNLGIELPAFMGTKETTQQING